MKSKAQISRQMYKKGLGELTIGQMSAVSKRYNAQTAETGTSTPAKAGNASGVYTVKFGRPSINGVKESYVKEGITMGEALKQSGMKINPDKEGVIEKETGDVIMFVDLIKGDAEYVVVPGVDSQ